MSRKIRIIALFIGVLAAIATVGGLVDLGGGAGQQFRNIQGEEVRIYGHGLYKNDSAFFAPVFMGTDLSIACLGIPLLLFTVFYEQRKQNLLGGLLLMSMLGLFLYYGASIAFGIAYNKLFLVYVALLSL